MKLPQLHIRDLFWLMLVVACLIGWWISARRSAVLEEGLRYNLDGLKTELESAGYEVELDDKGAGFRFFSGKRGRLLSKAQQLPTK